MTYGSVSILLFIDNHSDRLLDWFKSTTLICEPTNSLNMAQKSHSYPNNYFLNHTVLFTLHVWWHMQPMRCTGNSSCIVVSALLSVNLSINHHSCMMCDIWVWSALTSKWINELIGSCQNRCDPLFIFHDITVEKPCRWLAEIIKWGGEGVNDLFCFEILRDKTREI